MEQAIMWVMALGALIGGIDRLLGNRFSLGNHFEQGFMLLGPMALSMVGIICITPLISAGLSKAVVPVLQLFGLDGGMLGSLLAIDMGGYQLAQALAKEPLIGTYAGIVVSAMLGCTVSYTIPVGMGMASKQDQPLFAKGTLIGLGVMPIAMCTGGLLCDIPMPILLLQSLPVCILSTLLMLGIWKKPEAMVKGFSLFAKGIRLITTVGLCVAAFTFLTGYKILPLLAPIEDAMSVVSSIGIVLLGSLTIAQLLQRALRVPLQHLCRITGMNSTSIAGLLIGFISVTPALAMLTDMDSRGKIINAASFVCGASALSAHMAFAVSVDRSSVLPLLAAKTVGAAAGIVVATICTKRKKGGDLHAQL